MFEMMKNTTEQIISSYAQYKGSGMFASIFLISVLYIYILEHNKIKKTLLCYYSLLALFVIFNPLIAYRIIAVIQKDVYWRIFWILPVTIVIAYAASLTVLGISEKSKKVMVIFALVVIIIISGKFMFTKENYSVPSNWYKLPSQTIEVCNILENDCDGEIRVVVPIELEVSIRQYDANIQMAYGREGNVLPEDNADSIVDRQCLRDYMQQNVLDIQLICVTMKWLKCNYIVLNRNAQLSSSLEDFGYQYIASTDKYNIYQLSYEDDTVMNK